MATSIFVFVTLALINFLGSIIQGVAGIGDAIFLQVLWYMVCDIWPKQFLATPLGDEPVRAVALIMYIRLLFMAPLVVYLGLKDSVFSRSMTIMMAVPSTICTILGVLLYSYMDAGQLKLVLGISSLLFAFMYGIILLVRFMNKQKKMQKLRENNVKMVVEADALAEEAHVSANTSLSNLQASFTNHAPNNSIFFHPLPNVNHAEMLGLNASMVLHVEQAHIASSMATPNAPVPPGSFFFNNNTSIIAAAAIAAAAAAANPQPVDIDSATGLPRGTTEAFVSTITGDVFVASEAAVPRPTEAHVPPLSPSKLSPSRTMTYTRVRINRNLDENGKIKRNTKIGAAIAASLAGMMASLTGVNAPPQIIFILLFDAPNYIVRVNFSAQSIPSNIIRFLMAAGKGLFKWSQVPIYLDVIIFGYAGVFVGNNVGRLLGPISFNVFVLCLLLLSAMAMLISNVVLLFWCTLITVCVTVGFAYWENKKNKPIIDAQRESEMEIEKRIYDVLEELQRNNNSFIPTMNAEIARLQQQHQHGAASQIPPWVTSYDNDDDSMQSPAGVKKPPPTHPTSSEDHRHVTFREGPNGNVEEEEVVDVSRSTPPPSQPQPPHGKVKFASAKDVVVEDVEAPTASVSVGDTDTKAGDAAETPQLESATVHMEEETSSNRRGSDVDASLQPRQSGQQSPLGAYGSGTDRTAPSPAAPAMQGEREESDDLR